jgi:hypothetical protein
VITEDQLEQLAIQWFQDTGWNYVNGADLAPEGATPERADFRTVVLKARLAEAVRRLNPKLPPAAVEEVVHVVTTPTETSLPRNNRAFDAFAPAQSGFRPAPRAVCLARLPGGSAHRLLMDGGEGRVHQRAGREGDGSRAARRFPESGEERFPRGESIHRHRAKEAAAVGFPAEEGCMSDDIPNSEIILYQTRDGCTRIQCRFEDETLWLTQALTAEEARATIRSYRRVQISTGREPKP